VKILPRANSRALTGVPANFWVIKPRSQRSSHSTAAL
jgi:hypothetical protein